MEELPLLEVEEEQEEEPAGKLQGEEVAVEEEEAVEEEANPASPALHLPSLAAPMRAKVRVGLKGCIPLVPSSLRSRRALQLPPLLGKLESKAASLLAVV